MPQKGNPPKKLSDYLKTIRAAGAVLFFVYASANPQIRKSASANCHHQIASANAKAFALLSASEYLCEAIYKVYED